MTVVEETTNPQEVDLGKNILFVSQDRREVRFLLGEKEYTAIKPRKADEWFVELQMAISSDDNGKLLVETDRFFRKIVGDESYKELKDRRLDDDDDLTWTMMAESMYDLFEIWSTEPDQPIRPTGPRSGSGRGKARTTRK